MREQPPSRFEFEFLAFLAERAPLSSREIFEEFGHPRGYVRGTVIKSLDRLLKKGLVTRELREGIYVYSAAPNASKLEQSVVESFVQERLKGRLRPLLNYFSQAETVSDEDVAELRRLLDSLDGKDRREA